MGHKGKDLADQDRKDHQVRTLISSPNKSMRLKISKFVKEKLYMIESFTPGTDEVKSKQKSSVRIIDSMVPITV